MRVMRQIMSEEGKIPTIESSIEDKFEYKKLLYPPKIKKEKE